MMAGLPLIDGKLEHDGKPCPNSMPLPAVRDAHPVHALKHDMWGSEITAHPPVDDALGVDVLHALGDVGQQVEDAVLCGG